MVDEKRKYELKKRADAMADTRQRITEAAVELHGTVGPARTTVSAVAERAGVQRHTVYRHFPTEADLFQACSAHWGVAHPPPDPAGWQGLPDGLDELYRWYEETEAMISNILRDAELVEAVPQAMEPMLEYFATVRGALSRGLPRRKTVTAAVAHAADFRTWRSLAREGGLPRAKAVELVCAMVEHAASPR
jgi:AcrR family transcriptional regulator